MVPTRRTVLRNVALFGGLGGFAGCITEEPPSASSTNRERDRVTGRTTTAPTPTEHPPTKPTRSEETTKIRHSTDSATVQKTTPTESTIAPPEESVRSVGDVRVSVTTTVAQKAVVYESLNGSGGVLARPNRQFVVAAVRSASNDGFDSAAPPAYDAFSLVAGSETFPAVAIEDRTTGALTASLAGRGQLQYGDLGWEVGWIAFQPPSPLETETAAIRCRYASETVAWSVPDKAVATLGRPAPAFELRSFRADRNGSEVNLSLVAVNSSKVNGTFLAAIYWPTTGIADDDESFIIRRGVAAGERVEWSKSVSTEYTSAEDGTATARVDGVVAGKASVEVGTRTSA